MTPTILNPTTSGIRYNAKEIADLKKIQTQRLDKIISDYKETVSQTQFLPTWAITAMAVIALSACLVLSGATQMIVGYVAVYCLYKLGKREGHQEGYLDGYSTGQSDGVNVTFGIDAEQSAWIDELANDT